MGSLEKPKLDIAQQIDRLSQKGVKFDLISKEAACEYLSKNSNYFKLTAYRKTFQKHKSGENAGKYIDLDFGQLRDLAIIDMRLRYILIHLALDLEHYAKVRMIKVVQDSGDDGYEVVAQFLRSLNEAQKEAFEREIERSKDSSYCGDIIKKYDGGYPVWAFVEIIPFGWFLTFYKFCADYFDVKALVDEYFWLKLAKGIRNAAAHSNCILNDLSPNNTHRRTSYAVSMGVSRLPNVTKEIHRRKLSNVRVQQLITLLYAHKELVTSADIVKHRSKALHDVVDRMFHHIDYYRNNETILTTFQFVKIVIDNWFPGAYNDNT